MSQPHDSRADTLAHILRVRDIIDRFVVEMLPRGAVHDASKLHPDEKQIYDELIPLLRGLSYGSPEYEAIIARLGPALQRHFRRNSHHTEYYEGGVAGMDLFDVVEMLCDWIASSAREPNEGVKLDDNVARSGIDPQFAAILRNTLERGKLRPQRC